MPDRVALLLHMHQPEYRDPDTGRPRMPWVRLHASRGYTDVPVLAAEAGAQPTINVVPSLLLQLEAYQQGGTDRWEDLSRAPAEALAGDDLDFVRRRFVHGNPSMRLGSERYTDLAERAHVLDQPAELRDLQVWSNLAWMGVVARRTSLVLELRDQDRDFSHEQLLALMDLQRQLVCGVLGLWRDLPSISATPLCHPILPLLIDFKHARRCLPQLPADLGGAGDFCWPEDARRQLVEGWQVCERVLGRRPKGLWPSEGSVSPEVLDLVDELGLSWVATDEAVLHRSERDRDVRLDGPWVRQGHEDGVRLIFRDHALSDRVGFVYHRWSGQHAVDDLLAGARERWGWQPGAVPVILDGENPWEAYPDAGESFLVALFGSGRVVSMDTLAQAPAIGRVRQLHTGSWIDGDFRIWAGDPEDRRGWALVARLRQAYQDAGCPDAAWIHLANAESSDWTWWFGPEHHTDVADLFDALFRAHIAAGWRALGLPVPPELARPVQVRDGSALAEASRTGRLLAHSPIDPRLDARLHPGDWSGAAALPAPRGGSMAQGQRWLLGGAAGVGRGRAFLRFDLPPDQANATQGGHGGLWLERPDAPPLSLDAASRALDAAASAASTGQDNVEIVSGPGLVMLSLPWSGASLSFALRTGSGLRHPSTGWFVLSPPEKEIERQCSA